MLYALILEHASWQKCQPGSVGRVGVECGSLVEFVDKGSLDNLWLLGGGSGTCRRGGTAIGGRLVSSCACPGSGCT